MLILHVSDLHITAHGETLETVWNGPSSVLPDGRFDFVIVSGDLSQRASEAEYRDLVDFSRDHLVRLLKVTPERSRKSIKQTRGRRANPPSHRVANLSRRPHK